MGNVPDCHLSPQGLSVRLLNRENKQPLGGRVTAMTNAFKPSLQEKKKKNWSLSSTVKGLADNLLSVTDPRNGCNTHLTPSTVLPTNSGQRVEGRVPLCPAGLHAPTSSASTNKLPQISPALPPRHPSPITSRCSNGVGYSCLHLVRSKLVPVFTLITAPGEWGSAGSH